MLHPRTYLKAISIETTVRVWCKVFHILNDAATKLEFSHLERREENINDYENISEVEKHSWIITLIDQIWRRSTRIHLFIASNGLLEAESGRFLWFFLVTIFPRWGKYAVGRVSCERITDSISQNIRLMCLLRSCRCMVVFHVGSSVNPRARPG